MPPYFNGYIAGIVFGFLIRERTRRDLIRTSDVGRWLANPASFNHICVAREGTMRGMGVGSCVATALVATAALLVPAVASAYTAEQEQACTSDAFRLCSSDIPDVDRVTACMVRRKAELSPPCRAQFGPQPREAASSGRVDRPMSIRPAVTKKSASARAGNFKRAGRPDATE
jgi:hypothetical protein